MLSWPSKDPNEMLDYQLDWTKALTPKTGPLRFDHEFAMDRAGRHRIEQRNEQQHDNDYLANGWRGRHQLCADKSRCHRWRSHHGSIRQAQDQDKVKPEDHVGAGASMGAGESHRVGPARAGGGDWDESLHPRDEGGKFASGGGGGTGTSGPKGEGRAPKGNGKPAEDLNVIAREFNKRGASPKGIGPINVEVYGGKKLPAEFQAWHAILAVQIRVRRNKVPHRGKECVHRQGRTRGLESVFKEDFSSAAPGVHEKLNDELRSQGYDALIYTNYMGVTSFTVLDRNSATLIKGPPEPPPPPPPPQVPIPEGLDPVVTAVGGDDWNQNTAIRLEIQYQAARPKLERLTELLAEKPAPERTAETDNWDDDVPPQEWSEMSPENQDAAAETYVAQNQESAYESEVESWSDNGDDLDEAKAIVAQSPGKDEWLLAAIEEAVGSYEEPFPFVPYQLSNVAKLTYDNGNNGQGDFTVEFDTDKLNAVLGGPPQQLTESMRETLERTVEKSFERLAQEMVNKGQIDPPAYLHEQASDYLTENWAGMSDSEKFAWVEANTTMIEQASGSLEGVATGLPKKFDPLNETSGMDYKKTQAIASKVSLQRAKEVMVERGLPAPDHDTLRRADNRLWSAWKGSSTSFEGRLLQIAVAEELDGRLNPNTGHGGLVKLDPAHAREYAEQEFSAIGGYDGVKAYVRAKWETTQYLLDRAGIAELKLYRGVNLEGPVIAEALQTKETVGRWPRPRLPALQVVRNGAASTSVSAKVANEWGNSHNRVVLRALVPRTAAVSIPAYGVNVQSEQEVVVAGTAWKGWDAWHGEAPEFDDHPMKLAA